MSQQNSGVHFTGGHDGYRDLFLKYAVKVLGLNFSADEYYWASGEGYEAAAREGGDASVGDAQLRHRTGD